MKKFAIGLIVIAVYLATIGGVIATDITNAEYKTTISVTNAGAALTSAVAVLDMDTDLLINADMLDAGALQAAMTDGSGNDVPFMLGPPGTDKVSIMVNSIGASASINRYLYTKNVTGTQYYAPSTNGMSVNDTATIDIGTSGEYLLSGYLNTTGTGGGTIINKSDTRTVGPKVYTDTTVGRVTGGIVDFVAGVYPTYVGYAYTASDGDTTIAVTIPNGSVGDYIVIGVNGASASADITVSAPAGDTTIGTGDGNSGGVYWTSRYTYKIATAASESAHTYTWSHSSAGGGAYVYRFSGATAVTGTASATFANGLPDPPSLTTGWGVATCYWIVFAQTQASQATPPADYGNHLQQVPYNYVSVCRKTASAASDNPGTYPSSGYSLTETIAVRGVTTINPAYVLYVDGVSSTALHNVSLELDGGTLTLDVDGVTDNVAYAGTLANTVNLQMGSAEGTPFVSTMSVVTSGTERGEWGHQYATTFTDTSGNGNTGYPTFRTAASDVDLTASIVTMESLVGTSEPVAEGTGGEAWAMITTTPSAPVGLYTGGGTGFPSGPEVKASAEQAGQNSDVWLNTWALLWAIAAFLGAYALTHSSKMGRRGSLALAAGAAEVVMIYFYNTETINGWELIPFGLIMAAALLWRTSNSPVD